MRNNRQKAAWLLLLTMGFWFLGMGRSPGLAAALPPRPTPAPGKEPVRETGAYIKLQVEAAPAGLWTIVQWKDGLGDWHNVDGWQGTLDDGVSKLWWVAPKDFDTGPFRWGAYNGPNSQLVSFSPEFNLPTRVKQIINVDLALDPNSE